jgi:hypothetical protein
MIILLATPAWLLAPDRISRWSQRHWRRLRGPASVEAAGSDGTYAANDGEEEKRVLPAAE